MTGRKINLFMISYMRTLRFVFLSVFILLMLPTKKAFSQLPVKSKRQITKSDDRKIKLEALRIVKALAEEYNFLLSAVTAERAHRLSQLITPGPERIFLNDQVIIENDFYDREVKNLPKSERNKKVEEYFEEMSSKYGMKDNQTDRNKGKEVAIQNTTTTQIQALSARDSLFIKVTFDIAYDGVAVNGFKFARAPRVAQINMEPNGSGWKGYIAAIGFISDNRDFEDRSKAVIVVPDKVEKLIKYEEVNNDTIKIVSKEPFLRAFKMEDGWGLLSDEKKKVLAQPQFCEIEEFSKDGLAVVCKDGSWGYINQDGDIKIACIYDSANAFVNGKAVVYLGVKKYVIDKAGKEMNAR